MRTKLFFFAMLIGIAASAQVTNVEPLSANYTNKTVSFRVWWNTGSRDATHLSKVWVWIDFLKLNADNTTTGNTWTRAEISATPAVSSSPASTATLEASINKGFWLNGVTDSYSATVTALLDNISANTKFNWCAYASDYPPNMVMDRQTYYFKGTSPFILKEANGTAHEITQTSMPKANLTFVPVSITDKTECPGGLKEVIGTCPYTGTDWYADPNHKCQQRTGDAQNWEAWIKDTRDDELYRIVLMPDDNWWLAQNVKLESYDDATVGFAISGCSKESCGRAYTWAQVYASYDGGSGAETGIVQGICPPGWLLPIRATYYTLATAVSAIGEVGNSLRALQAICPETTNLFGYASDVAVMNGVKTTTGDTWYTNDKGREDGFILDTGVEQGYSLLCNGWSVVNYGEHDRANVRCFRQL